MSEWKLISHAPKDGRPVWCRETDWPNSGREAEVRCYWAYWCNGNWRLAGRKVKFAYPDEFMERPL